MAKPAENKHIGFPCGVGGEQNEVSAEEYWTEERRASAEPIPMPKLGRDERPAATGEAQPKGPPGHSPGHIPPSHGEEKSSEPQLDSSSDGGQPVAQPLGYPFCTVGRLCFVRNGHNLAASAALITQNVLLTAGHVVYNKDKGGGLTKPAFYPSYPKRAEKPNKDPAFVFTPSYWACKMAWYQDSNIVYDYGMLWVDADPGKMIGWVGPAWGQSTAGRQWTEVGYPIKPNPPFNGNTMEAVVGEWILSDRPGTIGLSNDNMGVGASGGPWITHDPISDNWNDPASFHVNGVRSYIHSDENVGYSPYFTQEVWGLVQWISDPSNRK